MRKIVIAAALVGAISTPAMAADWYIVKSSAGPAGATGENSGNYDPCMVVDRMAAATGEQQIAGPFPSQSAGLAEMADQAACDSTPADG